MTDENQSGQTSTDTSAGETQTDDNANSTENTGDENASGTGGEGEGQGSEEGKGSGEGEGEGSGSEELAINAPDGVEIDSALADAALPVFQKHNIPQEAVDELTAEFAKHQAAQAENLETQLEATRNQWLDDSKADKDFGGDNFDENAGKAKRVIDAVGTPELKKLFEDSGLGNHPEMIRMTLKIAPMVLEDESTGGGPAGNRGGDAASRMYPDDAKQG